MPQGSGIATYARNLNTALAHMGHETQILFGSHARLTSNNLFNQIALFDILPASRLTAWMDNVMRLIPPLAPMAREVSMTGEVITAEMAPRFPPTDRVWAYRDIFHTANRVHQSYRRFTPVRLGPERQTDLMHWTCLLPLHEPRVPNVYTLHDLIPLRLPFTTFDDKRAYYELCKTVTAKADRIITVSEHSRRDIIEFLGVPDDKVINTYQAVSLPPRLADRTDAEVAAELRGLFGLEPQGYFLFVAPVDAKKNPKRMLEAYAASLVKAPLVIVGRGWLDARVAEWSRDEVLEGADRGAARAQTKDRRRIRRYDYVPYPLLVSLIRGARGTVFPSLYEGFGLPVLESMLLGAPVITSTEGSLPEVAGEAALLVDPYDVDAIRDAIRTIDADEGLRQELIGRGRAQAAKFSAERYQQRLADAYAPLL
jgi:glycosyltransferase involved in cell wall biosynthesis